MSSGTEAQPKTGGGDLAAEVPCATFIEERLAQTRRQVKAVDLAGGVMTLAVGTLRLFSGRRFDRPLGGYRRAGIRRAADALAGPVGRRRILRCGAGLPSASPPDQPGIRRPNDREEPAAAEEQSDQLPAVARPSFRGAGGGLPRVGAPRGERPVAGRARGGHRSATRVPARVSAGRTAGRLLPLPGPFAQEPLDLGGAGSSGLGPASARRRG